MASSTSTTFSKYEQYPPVVIEAKNLLRTKNRNEIHNIMTIRAGLLKEAENGSGQAYYLLGKISHQSIGMPQDLIKAKIFYRYGATMKDPAAKRGFWKVSSEDEKEDILLLIKASGNNDKKACLLLSKQYFSKNNRDLALFYLNKACELGSAKASYVLFKLCDVGDIKASSEKTWNLLNKAADKGYIKAIKKILKHKFDIDTQRKKQFCEILAQQGMLNAYKELGKIYFDEQNYPLALEYCLLAQNDPDEYQCRMNLAYMYKDGLGCEKNLHEATKLFLEAAELEDCIIAFIEYIHLCDTLSMDIVNLPTVLANLHKAAINKVSGAAFALAIYYEDKEEEDTSLQYQLMAVDQGDPRAIHHLAIYLMQKDMGDSGDPVIAIPLLKSAGEKGFAKAYYALGLIYSKKEYEVYDTIKADDYFLKAKNMGFKKCELDSELELFE